MFRVENNVPDVYVTESRDFQLFARLYDLVFQSSRFCIDSMEDISDTMRCNDKLLPLIATKVGFFTSLNLTSDADRQILAAFPHIVRYKGSLYGLQLVTNLFGRITNTDVTIELDNTDPNHAVLVFEDYAPDSKLLYSLLEYIRPSGLVVDYEVRSNKQLRSDYDIHDKFTYTEFADSEPTAQLVYSVKNNKYPNIISNIGFIEVSHKPDKEKGEESL